MAKGPFLVFPAFFVKSGDHTLILSKTALSLTSFVASMVRGNADEVKLFYRVVDMPAGISFEIRERSIGNSYVAVFLRYVDRVLRQLSPWINICRSETCSEHG